jgi:hypothetical protein
MHIRCRSRIFQRGGSDEKNKVPDVLDNFLQFSLHFFLYFSEKGGFYTLYPLLCQSMVIESKRWGYRQFKGGQYLKRKDQME